MSRKYASGVSRRRFPAINSLQLRAQIETARAWELASRPGPLAAIPFDFSRTRSSRRDRSDTLYRYINSDEREELKIHRRRNRTAPGVFLRSDRSDRTRIFAKEASCASFFHGNAILDFLILDSTILVCISTPGRGYRAPVDLCASCSSSTPSQRERACSVWRKHFS